MTVFVPLSQFLVPTCSTGFIFGHQTYSSACAQAINSVHCWLILLILVFAGTGNQIMGLGGPQGGGMVQTPSIPASSCKLIFTLFHVI